MNSSIYQEIEKNRKIFNLLIVVKDMVFEYKINNSSEYTSKSIHEFSINLNNGGRYGIGIKEGGVNLGRYSLENQKSIVRDSYGSGSMLYESSAKRVQEDIVRLFGKKGYAKNPLETGLVYDGPAEGLANKTDLSRGRWEFP